MWSQQFRKGYPIMNHSKNDQEYLVQKIRTQYTEKQHTELDELKALDRKVKAPANTFAYTFGSVAALVMGTGMSLIMTDISTVIGLESPMLPGLAIGIAGMLMAIINYPIYKAILGSRRKKYAQRIIALSDRITKE